MEENIKTIDQAPETDQQQHHACGCGSGGCGSHSQDHNSAKGQMAMPIRFQILRQGDRVVEFGSGTGNDCLAAANIVGDQGKVVGIDVSTENVNVSRDYADRLKKNNVEFREGNIEAVPLPKEYANIVYSNCVFNLQDNKQKVADEMYRIANHNGLACVTDFVTFHEIPDGLREEAAKLAGCIKGAENIEAFQDYFRKTGFQNVEIVEINKVHLPDDMFKKHLTDEKAALYKSIDSDEGIFSVTLIGEKPASCQAETCCGNPDKHMN
jgi:ubiquinone/menaquinone biosynthesis C-methylase UbiE